MSIAEDFEAFVDANPWVVSRLAADALDLRRRGYRRLSIDMLFNVLRHQTMLTNDPNSKFKLNNNYRALMARLLMERYPELDGAFEVRRLTTGSAA